MTWLVAALFVLICIHAIVSLLSAALQNVSRAGLRERAEEGDNSAVQVLALTEEALRLGMTVSLAHILTRFAIATVLVLLVNDSITTGDLAARLAVALITVILGATATLVLGDLVPEALGSTYAENLYRLAITPMRALVMIMSPLTALVLFLSRLISRLFGGEPLVNLVTEEEILSLVSAGHSGGTIEEEERDMIYSVLQLGDSNARELMTPRIDIVALEVNDTMMVALSAFVDSGFSRLPVYEGSIDKVIGLLIAKDILTLLENRDDLGSSSIRELIRPAWFVPESKRADALLKEMQAENIHLAVVVDEYGGTSGLITIENLIEEIIGDIRDEYDVDEEEEFVALGDGSWLIDGSMDLDDLNDLLDCSIDTNVTDTLGGYIYLHLGRVPNAEETITTDILSMTVKSIDGHRIRKVAVRKIASEAPDAATAPPESSGSAAANRPGALTENNKPSSLREQGGYLK
ncbi:MAG: hemolysin family protein [Chloroflexi bacterium]|nr:hemolysin family protein [Chloroflexota bacterium]